MSNRILIGLHGKARTGKDTLANHLIKKHQLLRYGPSVRVKDTTAIMFDFPRWYLDDDAMKDMYDDFWGMTYREMAQKVGKESSRDVFGNDIWMRHVERQLIKIENGIDMDSVGHARGIILADIRYANEAVWVKNHGGTVFFIVRGNAPKISGIEGHEGEAGLPLDLADSIIYNDGTIEDLCKHADIFLDYARGIN